MKRICVVLLLFASFSNSAKLNVMDSLYLAEPPVFDPEDEESFEMTGELGVLATTGNTDGTSISTKVNVRQNLTNWFHNFNANFLYKQNNSEEGEERKKQTIAQKITLSSQTDYKLKKENARLFAYGEYEDDRFNAYQYQAAIAVGYSDSMWKSEKSEFRYSVGPGYALSRLNSEEEGQEQSGIILRAAIEYEKKISETATFRQFVSTEADSDFSRSVSETSLAAKINGSLAMKVSLNMTHNKSPDNNGKSLDTQTAVTLVYNFY